MHDINLLAICAVVLMVANVIMAAIAHEELLTLEHDREITDWLEEGEG